MAKLRFGIVGTGMIAGVVADAIVRARGAELTAVSGRRIETAQKFVAERAGVEPVQGIDNLLARSDVDAVYIATPTAAKEALALESVASGKHILVDKPFVDHASALRIAQAAAAKGLVFMDATHFVHHQRTRMIQRDTAEKIGLPRSLHTTFYFPFSDRSNIRFDVTQEPMGALGDMAWYSLKAVVEYLRPIGRMKVAVTVAERDQETRAIVRASGLIAFESDEVSTFDVGYTAGAALMDLQLLGTKGAISMDDFVLDWANSWAFKNAESPTRYSHTTGMATRQDVVFVPTPSETAQEVEMIDNFAELARLQNVSKREEFVSSTLKTQEYLDAVWVAANAKECVKV